MSKPRFRWWGYILAILRAYPELCAKLQQLKNQHITASYEPSGGGKGGIARPTESAALAELRGTEGKEYNAVRQAIEYTAKLKSGTERNALIDMVYFKKTKTMEGTAVELFISYSTAKRWHKEFVLVVADFYGLLDDGLTEVGA